MSITNRSTQSSERRMVMMLLGPLGLLGVFFLLFVHHVR